MTEAPGASSAPIMTPHLVATFVRTWLASKPDGHVLALKAAPEWPNEHVIDVDGESVRIVPCVSSLAVRAALTDRADGERLVILTDRDARDLGVGLLSHLVGRQLQSTDLWLVVRQLFGADSVERMLVEEGKWVAEALVEHQPPEGWPATPRTGLSREHAMRALCSGLLGLRRDELDVAGVLQWTTQAADVVRFEALPRAVRDGVSKWLAEVAGPIAGWVLAAVNGGHGTDAVPLGLVAGLLWKDGTSTAVASAAKVRFEAYVGGGQSPHEADARAWSDASQAWVERLRISQDHVVDRALLRAEAILHELQAGALVSRSDVLPSSLRDRLRDFASAIRSALTTPGGPRHGDGETELMAVRTHMLAQGESRVDTALMAQRVLRWLALGEAKPPATLAAAVEAQVREDSWVDRAKLDLWTGDLDPEVADAYKLLFDAVDARRDAADQRFAELLAKATADDDLPGSLLLVEDVLQRVVKPVIAAKQRVLLLVVDGMSAAASHELVEDVTRTGWVEHTFGGGQRGGVLAAFPTLTSVSRTSLFSGRIANGHQAEERAGLQAVCGGGARIFHAGDLITGAGAALPQSLMDALSDVNAPLVAVVINTIDDSLESGDPAGAAWNLKALPIMGPLLKAASDRTLIMLSDHGHVIDRGQDADYRSTADGESARWRPASSPATEGEVVLRGRRVLLGDGEVILPWRETIRYAPRKAGYHGGASAAEAVIPLTVLTRGAGLAGPGWLEAPPQAPTWWLEALLATTRHADEFVAVIGASDSKIPTLFDAAEPAAVEQAPPVSGGIAAAVLSSEVYAIQRRRAGRAALKDELVLEILRALLAMPTRRLRIESLAAEIGYPQARMVRMFSMLQRILNVEGYPVIALNVDGATVELDTGLLTEQFHVAEEHP